MGDPDHPAVEVPDRRTPTRDLIYDRYILDMGREKYDELRAQARGLS